MAGSALGQLGMTVMLLVTIVGIVRARRTRGQPDADAEARRAAKLEMDRRMAAYLASRQDK